MTAFRDLGLSALILRAVDDLGFERPSEIQEKAIPILLENDGDFLGLAQTGTGKTAAFGLPLLQKIDHTRKKVQAVVLSPTRELCQQISGQMKKFATHLSNTQIITVYGGASIRDQIREIKRGGQIVVATPGRLIDLLNRKVINLAEIDFLVLDEADEMLNMGFKEELDTILSYAPDIKSTWLFSATMPKEIRRISKEYMTDPLEVQIKSQEIVNKDIRHFYVTLKRDLRVAGLERIIDLHPDIRTIVFCRTKQDTQNVVDQLIRDGYSADFINGDLSQAQREKAMKKFKSGGNNVLVATDVAARGIDVNDLSHVIHFNLPDQLEYYTHRSGRTARGGKTGKSVIFCSSSEIRKVRRIEKELKIEVVEAELPSLDQLKVAKVQKYIDKIFAQEVLSEGSHSLLETEILDQLMAIEPELLIRKLVARDLKKVLTNTEDKLEKAKQKDKERKKGRDRGKDRSRKSDKKRDGKKRYKEGKTSPDHVTFSLSIGKNDISNVGHILRILHQYTGLGKANYGYIGLNRDYMTLEVDKKWESHFKQSIKGLRVNKKTIKVKKI